MISTPLREKMPVQPGQTVASRYTLILYEFQIGPKKSAPRALFRSFTVPWAACPPLISQGIHQADQAPPRPRHRRMVRHARQISSPEKNRSVKVGWLPEKFFQTASMYGRLVSRTLAKRPFSRISPKAAE